ncbi:DNA-binding transcriptional regulator [Dryocola sp. BD613]|uniref:DNA-binding transcriptional regulator n=1 Tax=Dryocola sp. BD613 TaxID=3133272 RepID=UPI003F50325A
MFHCSQCQHAAHARTRRYLTENTKERYHQRTNINCSCTFVTMESGQRFIVTPCKIDFAPPHSVRSGQQNLWL